MNVVGDYKISATFLKRCCTCGMRKRRATNVKTAGYARKLLFDH